MVRNGFWRVFACIGLSVLLTTACGRESSEDPGFAGFSEELDYLVGRYVKMGAAIGVIDRQQQEKEYFFGRLSASDPTPPNRHTVFEVGSISKTFTGTLLAVENLAGRMRLDDPVQAYLPASLVTMPGWSGVDITVRHLATHASGLERRPQDSDAPLPAGYDPNDPYATYTAAHIYEYLTRYCRLLFEPGTQYSYSNTGGGLLGHILGRVDESSFQQSLDRQVLRPLGLEETALVLTPGMAARLATGHDQYLEEADIYHWNDVFQGAGAVKSTLHDMMIYLKANMGLESTSLQAAMGLALQAHFDVGDVTYNDREGHYQLAIGLAWHIDELPEGYVFRHHGGRTNGYMAYIGFDQVNFTGVVILCNQSSPDVVLRFGEDLLKAVNRY